MGKKVIDILSDKIYNEVAKGGAAMLISIADYAAKHGRSHIAARKMAARGGFKTVQKIANHWIIDENEPYPDARIKTGKYVNWRKGQQRSE